MDKELLQKKLQESHNSFLSYLNSLTSEEFLRRKENKWSAGQQLEHIYLSVRPVRQVLSLPKFIPKLIWGLANRESRTYEDLVTKYLHKLANGGRATGPFIPKGVSVEKGAKLKIKLDLEVSKLMQCLDKFSEEELDRYVIPHPLLGKLTIREMIYFSIYHVGHHDEITKRNLNS